jgi:hypothetical protein
MNVEFGRIFSEASLEYFGSTSFVHNVIEENHEEHHP